MTKTNNKLITDDDYELIIVGGGINGAGIARDAGMRGLKVLLLEAGDFGHGTSSWSTRLIHGGLRYLEYGELSLVWESLHERRRLLANAAHLVKPLCLTIPIYRGAKRGRFLVRLGMLAYDLLSLGKQLPSHASLSRQQLLAAEPGLASDGLVGGVSYYDAQVTYAERLVLENVLAAETHGVTVRNHTPVTGLRAIPGDLHEVRFRPPDGEEGVARAPVIINAAGPWVDAVLSLAERKFSRLMGGTKGSHIIVGRFSGAPANAVYVEARSDGRPIFIVPWNGQYLIGTTDIRTDADPDNVHASGAEIAYLLDESNRVFPEANLDTQSVHFAYAGVRPLPFQEEGPESAITRRHIIHAHEGDAFGIVSIIGGKLTTYRNLAEQTVDKVLKLLQRQSAVSPTREAPLPGGAELKGAVDVARALAPGGSERLLGIYGARVRELKSLCDAEPELGRHLDEAHSLLAAEVALAVRAEFALTLIDILHRRLMIGLSPTIEAALVNDVAALAAGELGWDSAERDRQIAELRRYNEGLGRPLPGADAD